MGGGGGGDVAVVCVCAWRSEKVVERECVSGVGGRVKFRADRIEKCASGRWGGGHDGRFW